MKIWITRQSTGELHAGGLERCRVWFQKPKYVMEINSDFLKDLPFGDDESKGISAYWLSANGFDGSISFGRIFGYGDDSVQPVQGLAVYVWSKLREHYGNARFVDGWYEYEKAGNCHQSQFLLEIDLDVKWSVPEVLKPVET